MLVATGTTTVLPPHTVQAMAAAFASVPDVSFVWSLKEVRAAKAWAFVQVSGYLPLWCAYTWFTRCADTFVHVSCTQNPALHLQESQQHLPEGYTPRHALITTWVHQTAVLGHPAVKGFLCRGAHTTLTASGRCADSCLCLHPAHLLCTCRRVSSTFHMAPSPPCADHHLGASDSCAGPHFSGMPPVPRLSHHNDCFCSLCRSLLVSAPPHTFAAVAIGESATPAIGLQSSPWADHPLDASDSCAGPPCNEGLPVPCRSHHNECCRSPC
jgi:hypothetical protein